VTQNAPVFDLIVVGGGGSGLIAAATAARRGLKVVILEKADQVGGTTGLSVGTSMAAGTEQQQLSQGPFYSLGPARRPGY
jgi:fumarate reductase flavoprotein subunit